nr:acetolactate synthase large subunit [Actinomadura rugatobispora]
MIADSGATHFFHVPVFAHHAMSRLIELGVTPVVTHGEKAAAYMADGYARVSGRPGLCGAQAIGGTNLAAGLRDAYLARTPVIAFTGGPRAETRHRNVYQEHDDMPVFDRLTKFNAVIDRGERLPDLVRQAYRAATSGVPRPVHLELAGAVGDAVGGEAADGEAVLDARYTRAPAVRAPAEPEAVRKAAALLAEARRPLVLIGGGVKRSGAEAVLAGFADRWGLPAVASLNGLGVLPEQHPLWAGVVGSYARDEANTALAEADAVLVVGSSLGSMTTRNFTLPAAGCPVAHIDIDPEEAGRGRRGVIPLVGDARTVLEQLDGRMSARTPEPWRARVSRLRARWRERAGAVEAGDHPSLRPESLWRAVSDALPGDAIVVADTGHAGAWSARHLHLGPGHAFIRAAGSLGWALPAAIGAKCAAPERPVVCLTGDAGFYYHVAELETARRYGVNIVVVVNDNAGMNQEAVLWREGTPEERNWRFEPVDLAAVAASFGCHGQVVEKADQVAGALAAALASGRPAVVDARTDPAVVAPTVHTEAAGNRS